VRHFLVLPFLFGALLIVVLASLSTSYAQVDTFEFENDDQLQRFRHLSNEFRCPMCQNTNLTGSTGGVAEDLRREIHRMIVEGLTDKEIEQFMFERYGDFIFYRPRLRAETILLWFGPLGFFLIGGGITYRMLRRAKRVQKEQVQLDTADSERLQNLLNDQS